jgi:hypothetical protein
MPIAYESGSAIECASAHLKLRRLNLKPPRKNKYPQLKSKLLYHFKLDLNSTAIVTKELDPKTSIINARSMLNLGDGIQGDTISVLSLTNVRHDDVVVSTGSASHKAQFVDVKNFVYATLEKSFKGLSQMNRGNILLG